MMSSGLSFTFSIQKNNKSLYIFTKDKTYLDIQSLLEDYQDYGITQEILNSPCTQIFFYSHLLTGSKELESNPYLFGELDKDNTLKQEQPTYHFFPKDEENNLGTLLIFLNSSTLTLLNYSLLHSSLNITLELTHKESKTKQEEAKVKALSKTQQEINIPLSTSYLHPILEDNEIKCFHGGVAQLKSNQGKTIQSNNIPFILETTKRQIA